MKLVENIFKLNAGKYYFVEHAAFRDRWVRRFREDWGGVNPVHKWMYQQEWAGLFSLMCLVQWLWILEASAVEISQAPVLPKCCLQLSLSSLILSQVRQRPTLKTSLKLCFGRKGH